MRTHALYISPCYGIPFQLLVEQYCEIIVESYLCLICYCVVPLGILEKKGKKQKNKTIFDLYTFIVFMAGFGFSIT